MVKTELIWRSDIAKKLLEVTGASTVEEAIPMLVDKKMSMFGELKLPIDLQMVASSFNISSHFNYVPMKSAARLRHDGSRYVIDVNNATNEQRQRFSIAHEIGHKALADRDIRITKYRGSAAYTAEEREEEEICDAISATILGLRADIIRRKLSEHGLTFSTIEQTRSEYNTSFEATLRAFLRYCEAPAAGVYCEMHGGLVGGLANQFIVRRAYCSYAFVHNIPNDCILSNVVCLRDALRQQGKIITMAESIAFNNKEHCLQTQAKRMTIYVQDQPKPGVVMILNG